uniref:Uncharacterized protein n=1 Tax=Oryza meridionalis TaxID=40149 RepID=A0A0E0DKE1_9ORYZ
MAGSGDAIIGCSSPQQRAGRVDRVHSATGDRVTERHHCRPAFRRTLGAHAPSVPRQATPRRHQTSHGAVAGRGLRRNRNTSMFAPPAHGEIRGAHAASKRRRKSNAADSHFRQSARRSRRDRSGWAFQLLA